MRRLALAEHEPVARACLRVARAEMRAQARDAGAVADQDQRPVGVVAEAEVAVRQRVEHHPGADLGVARQPARGQAEAAVGTALLAHEQVRAALGGDRGDRVFARLVGRMRHADLQQVAGLPRGRRAGGRLELQVEHRGAAAARVDMRAPRQPPRLARRFAPGERVADAGQPSEFVLPARQVARGQAVDIDAPEQRPGLLRVQPGVEAPSERAEVREPVVAEGEQPVVQARQRVDGRSAHETTDEGGGAVRRVAFAAGARDEQHRGRRGQVGGRQRAQRRDAQR